MIKKNETYTTVIDDLTYEGMGVAHIDGFALFVENALPGEEVELLVVKTGKKFGYGKVLKRLSDSSERVPVENHDLLRSGIAPLSHMKYESQLVFKQNQIKHVMDKIAHLPEVEVKESIGMEKPYAYRNKAQIPVRNINGELTTGFYRKNSHDLLPIEDYFIQDPKIDEAILVVRDILRRFNVKPYNEEENTGFLRHIVIRRGHYSHEMMVVLVTRKEKFFKGVEIATEIQKALPEVVSVVQNVNTEKTNVILGRQENLLLGREYIFDNLLGKTYRISAQSFYQVNTEQAEKLYQLAIDLADLQSTDTVIDAYCGIGTIGLSFADRVHHVYGVEVVKQAINDAKFNALKNEIDNVTFRTGKAEDIMLKWVEKGIRPDVIFVDPPRKGLTESFIEATAEINPAKIVYISCNPATLARDLKHYATLGYEAKSIQPVDLFPQTNHVESVTLLNRIK